MRKLRRDWDIDAKDPEEYSFMVDGVPLRIRLTDDEYDGVAIQQDGGPTEHLPPNVVLWLAERVREYYPEVEPYKP